MTPTDADDRGELELPVVLLAAGGEDDIVIGPGHGACGAKEDVGLAGGDPVVHDLGTLGLGLFVRELPALGLFGDTRSITCLR